MRKGMFIWSLVLIVTMLSWMLGTAAPIVMAQPDIPDTLLVQAQQRGSVPVIVGLRVPPGQSEAVERAAIAEAQNRVLARLASQQIGAVKRFGFIPAMALQVDPAGLATLQALPEVLRIEEDRLTAPTLAESTALIGAPRAWGLGFAGAGQTIAILDTGVDKAHSFLAGKVVLEACFSTTALWSSSLCPGGVSSSTAVNSGLPCPQTLAGCSHGTHVAGIAAGRGSSFSGVARDAQLIAIQVFSRFNTAESCSPYPAPCVASYTSDQIAALDWVFSLRTSRSIAAVNLSLGGDVYTAACDAVHTIYKAAIDRLLGAGIATVIAAGNNDSTSGISSPACISTAIAVGSTRDGSSSATPVDTIAYLSNSANLVDLLAPGQWITSSVPGGGFEAFQGTSMAAPHVAGAFAVLKSRSPTGSVAELLSSLSSTGRLITDPRNNVTKPRIQLDRALNHRLVQFSGNFDGDGRTDIAVWRPSDGNWYIINSSNGATRSVQWGAPNDVPVPGNYDSDGRTDIAVWRPSDGNWYIINSSNGATRSVQWGAPGDVPVPGNYDGDGQIDIAVWRPSDGNWHIINSSNGATRSVQWGASGDVPVPGNYDGDGRTDIAVWRPSNGNWYMINSLNGATRSVQWGASSDVPVPGNYDGDGRTDIAVWRPGDGNWHIINSSNGATRSVQWGAPSDVPVPGNYDGDGRTDIAVWRPSDGNWHIINSSNGATRSVQWGAPSDVPV